MIVELADHSNLGVYTYCSRGKLELFLEEIDLLISLSTLVCFNVFNVVLSNYICVRSTYFGQLLSAGELHGFEVFQ